MENSNYKNTQSLSLLSSLFFMWGFITCMNDILIPYLKSIFDLQYFEASLVQFAFFGAYFMGSVLYFFISVSFGDPINKIGYKKGIVIGLLISAASCALFIPAANLEIYFLFLAALFCLGLGFTILQISANPYVAILGKPETASSRLNLAQGFNSLGTFIAPLLGGYLIFEYFAEQGGANAVKTPYLLLSGVLFALAIFMNFVKLPKFQNEDKLVAGFNIFNFNQVNYGMLAIFMYVGAEVAIGSFLINFLGLEEIMGMEKKDADSYLSLYWGGAMIGRFVGAISLNQNKKLNQKSNFMILVALGLFLIVYGGNYLNNQMSYSEIRPLLIFIGINLLGFVLGKSLPSRTLGIFATIAIILLSITIFGKGEIAMWTLIGVGLFNSIMWSNIFTISIDGLKEYTSQASSLLVMMILGGALMPPIQALVADSFKTPNNNDAGLQISFIIPLLCYVYLAIYGFFLNPKENKKASI